MSLQLALRTSLHGSSASAVLRKFTPTVAAVSNSFSTSTREQGKSHDEFWKKNVDLKRPVSPHLQIYAPQLTSMLSITNRMTGVAVGLGLTAFSVGMFLSSSPYAVHLNNLRCLGLPAWFHYGTKFIMAWCVSYHTLAGIRHLVWDTKSMLKIDQVYQTGYIMAAGSVILATILTMLWFPSWAKTFLVAHNEKKKLDILMETLVIYWKRNDGDGVLNAISRWSHIEAIFTDCFFLWLLCF